MPLDKLTAYPPQTNQLWLHNGVMLCVCVSARELSQLVQLNTFMQTCVTSADDRYWRPVTCAMRTDWPLSRWLVSALHTHTDILAVAAVCMSTHTCTRCLVVKVIVDEVDCLVHVVHLAPSCSNINSVNSWVGRETNCCSYPLQH